MTDPLKPCLHVTRYLEAMDNELMHRDGSAELSHTEAKTALRDVYLIAKGETPEFHPDRMIGAPRDDWQPISTAPKDGTHFLAYALNGDMYRAAYHQDGYFISFCGQPAAHDPEPDFWQPLPSAPQEAEG